MDMKRVDAGKSDEKEKRKRGAQAGKESAKVSLHGSPE
ncbi:hypothetical protein EZS27_019141 [termite gut metagenome]|uniref:Uncharacterized protein n=1 Tax=termite gut metagenome TaxID=433724 RepID=A0A5J4RFE8_9ZZZZ